MATPDFDGYAGDNRRIWEANARWWDDRVGDGNGFQDLLIQPAAERLLDVRPGDRILDVACGAGRFARHLAHLGATVVAFDQSAAFLERARQRTPVHAAIQYHRLDASDVDGLLALGVPPFDKAVCTMALMDMPQITPLLSALPRVLRPGGAFVFTVTHPCFHAAGMQRFAEVHQERDGRRVLRTGVKVTSYLTPEARRTEGILGQPEAQYDFHRPLHVLLGAGLAAGFVVDGIDEPALPGREPRRATVSWDDMPAIPPILAVRLRLPAWR